MNYIKYLVLLLFFFASLHASLTSKSAIFYYGDDTPYSLLGIHDYIILKPESANEFTHGFKIYKDNIYAQIDIATLDLKGSYSADFDKQWILSNSVIQDSELLDMSNQDYHLFIYNNIINPLIEQGYKNFYFDHLNVYQASTIRDEKQALIEEGIIKFLYEFNHRYPDAKIILNAESKIIAKVHDFIEALVYESLFKGLSSNGFNYVDVSNLNRELLLSEISKVQKYNKPIIILDYLPFSKRALMTETLKKIEAFNFIPYIGNRTLSAVGQSSKNALKREVLFLYDGTFENKDIDETSAFQQGALPIEYLGYIPILYDVSKKILSDDILQRYAGVVVWLNGEYTRKEPKAFIRWVHALRKNDLKILFFEGLDSDYHLSIFKTLDIDIEKDVIDNTKKKIISDSEYIGYEVDPFFPSLDTYFHPKNSQVLCQVKTEENYSVMAAITPWGGYAFEGSMLIEMAGNTLWIANPFKLFQEALRLQPLAVPDFTTDNGKRLLFIHMDGDGIMNAAEWDAELFSGDVLYDEVFTQYDIPMSISIIEGETASYGLYPEIAQRLEILSRKIFALDNIEPASHTYTHPYYWGKIVDDDLALEFRLQVKNYDFSLDREIRGSLEYINTRLAPKDKQANMIFWSGDCLPGDITIDYMYKNNILQINGGDTTIINSDPWISLIASAGLKRGDYYQIFTGAQNENVYTNDWLGPFWGFKRVIQTFQLTESPKRFKPIDIYYHTYSGSKRASLNALHKVYKWAIKQDVMPIYTSKYIPKVMDFYEVSLANEKDTWLIRGSKNLKTVRIEKDQGVDFGASHGIVGMKTHESGRYIHLNQDEKQILVLSQERKNQNYLIDANVALVHANRYKKSIDLLFQGEVAAEIRYHVAKGCELNAMPIAEEQSKKDGVVLLKYTSNKDVHVIVTCE